MQAVVSMILGTMIAVLALGAVPSIDKGKLEAYLRYAEGFMSNVHFTIEDPVASEFPNFFRVNVHLTTEKGAKLDRIYYVTADGRQIINGTIWDIDKSPFAPALSRLPANGYSFGPANAKVHLVIFSDFECPFCREFAKTVRENIPKKYPNEVQVTFEDFPLDAIHPWARAAAEASHCVGNQDGTKFWAYHDWIFEVAPEIKPDNLKSRILTWAKQQNLDTGKLETCIDTHAEAKAVQQSENAAKRLDVQQTPTSFANGRPIPGALPWSNLDSVIELELKGAEVTSSPVVSR